MDKFILYSILKVYIDLTQLNQKIINLNLFDVNVSCHTYINSTFPSKVNTPKYLLAFKPSLPIMKEEMLPILSITFAFLYYPQE
jgi:hypothetical protein